MVTEIEGTEGVESTQTAPEREEQQNNKKQLEPVRRRVLLVEDDPANREALEEILLAWGYEPYAVGSAEEAEYAVRRRKFDAAIVDVFLPGKSGANLLSGLRELFPTALLIGVSGLTDASVARQCKGVGADRFIGKPISLEELSDALGSTRTSWH